MKTFFDGFINDAGGLALKILLAIVILVVGIIVSKCIVKLIFKLKLVKKLDDGVESFLKGFLKVILYIVVFMISAGTVGISMTSLVTLLASFGAAIALALQGGLGNLAGGIMILIFKPFKVEDYIEAEGCAGTVKAITIFYTVLTTPDNKTVSLPNGALTNSPITNYSTEDIRRVDFTFSVDYSSDIEKVKRILIENASAHELVLPDPAPFARLMTQNTSSLDFVLRVWVKKADYWTVKFDLTESTKKTFDENGIEIPFQQLDVHFDDKKS